MKYSYSIIEINHCFKHSIKKLIITHDKNQKIIFISSSNFNFENTDFFILNKNGQKFQETNNGGILKTY